MSSQSFPDAMLFDSLLRPLSGHPDVFAHFTTAVGRHLQGNEMETIPAQVLERQLHTIALWLEASVKTGAEWLTKHNRNDPQRRPSRLLGFQNFDDLYALAEQELKRIDGLRRKMFEDLDDSAEVKEILPLQDGMRWVKLLTKIALQREGCLMNHCAGDAATVRGLNDPRRSYYSLRDAQNAPQATMELANNKIMQCKSRGDVPVLLQYLPQVRKLISEKRLVLSDLGPRWTGLVLHEGVYHSLYALPEGLMIDNLDLRGIKTSVVLPRNMTIGKDLFFDGAFPIDYEACVVGGLICIEFDKRNLPQPYAGPNLVRIHGRTRVCVQEIWLEDGKNVQEIVRNGLTGKVVTAKRYWHDPRHIPPTVHAVQETQGHKHMASTRWWTPIAVASSGNTLQFRCP